MRARRGARVRRPRPPRDAPNAHEYRAANGDLGYPVLGSETRDLDDRRACPSDSSESSTPTPAIAPSAAAASTRSDACCSLAPRARRRVFNPLSRSSESAYSSHSSSPASNTWRSASRCRSAIRTRRRPTAGSMRLRPCCPGAARRRRTCTRSSGVLVSSRAGRCSVSRSSAWPSGTTICSASRPASTSSSSSASIDVPSTSVPHSSRRASTRAGSPRHPGARRARPDRSPCLRSGRSRAAGRCRCPGTGTRAYPPLSLIPRRTGRRRQRSRDTRRVRTMRRTVNFTVSVRCPGRRRTTAAWPVRTGPQAR